MTLQTAPGGRSPASEFSHSARTERMGGDILACGFGMTVAAWIAAYLTRMPLFSSPAPGQVTVGLMLVTVLVGGFFTARYSSRGILAAALAGAVSGFVDVLIVLSLVHDSAKSGAVAPAAALWVGGSVLLNTVVAAVGGALGALFPSKRRGSVEWAGVFSFVLAAATLPLITVGGLVTAFGVGMAVPDWPRSYGYNMFLFPLSQMQANHGNFYEHAHRLMGTLVGLTSLVMAFFYTAYFRKRKTWPITAAWLILVSVVIQGMMGGFRVTENSIPLATVHGIFAQIVFASMAALAAATSSTFTHANPDAIPPEERPTDAVFPICLVASLVLQLTLGALVRQKVDSMIIPHITLAAFVALLALACGFRALAMHAGLGALKRIGGTILLVVLIQLLLGVMALVVRPGAEGKPTTTSALFTTAHQANGALLMAVSAVLVIWTLRMRAPVVPSQDSPATDLAAA